MLACTCNYDISHSASSLGLKDAFLVTFYPTTIRVAANWLMECACLLNDKIMIVIYCQQAFCYLTKLIFVKYLAIVAVYLQY